MEGRLVSSLQEGRCSEKQKKMPGWKLEMPRQQNPTVSLIGKEPPTEENGKKAKIEGRREERSDRKSGFSIRRE